MYEMQAQIPQLCPDLMHATKAAWVQTFKVSPIYMYLHVLQRERLSPNSACRALQNSTQRRLVARRAR